MSNGSAFPARARSAGLACAVILVSVGRVASAQERRPPGSQAPPRAGTAQGRETVAPFRRLEFDGIPVEFLALNDEACPLQISSGRLARTAVGSRILSVEVKSLREDPADSFLLGSLVFDEAGVLKSDRSTGIGGPIARWQTQSVDLPLDRSSLAKGDYIVLAVKEVAWSGGRWRSEAEEVLVAATQAVSASAARKAH